MPTLLTDDGIRLDYRQRGTRLETDLAPIVFVHGWASRASHWEAQLRFFGRRRRVIALDRRGHGRSEPSPTLAGHTAERHARDLEWLLVKESLAPPVVVAHAGGVPTALSLAASRPDDIRALVFVDSRLGPAARLEDPDDFAGSAYRGMLDGIRGPDGRNAFRDLYAPLFSEAAGPAGDRALEDALEMPLEIVAAELESLTLDTLELARATRAPVLWISAGETDESTLREAFGAETRTARNAVQFGQTVGSGHFPQLEVPDQINAMIERFLATLGKG